MNVTQLKYARNRAEEIYKARVADLREAHTTSAVILTLDEKLAALQEGRFTLNPQAVRYDRWQDAVEFQSERSASFDQAGFDADKGPLDAAYQRLEDELVLGDNELAMQLLKEFEASASA